MKLRYSGMKTIYSTLLQSNEKGHGFFPSYSNHVLIFFHVSNCSLLWSDYSEMRKWPLSIMQERALNLCINYDTMHCSVCCGRQGVNNMERCSFVNGTDAALLKNLCEEKECHNWHFTPQNAFSNIPRRSLLIKLQNSSVITWLSWKKKTTDCNQYSFLCEHILCGERDNEERITRLR